MTIFGFCLWDTTETKHIRDGQRRIGDALHGIADDLDAARRLNAEGMGINHIQPRPQLAAALDAPKANGKTPKVAK